MKNKSPVFIAACIAILIFGIMMTTLGSILPSIFEKFGIDKMDAGSLFLFMTFGMLLGSIVFGPVVDRFGYKLLLIACSCIIVLGLEGLAFSPALYLLKLSLFLIGFGGGIINGGANALVADISGDDISANLSLLGVFFGIGALGVPLLMGTTLRFFTYETLIASIGGMVLLAAVYFAITDFPPQKIKQGFPVRKGIRLLKDPRLLLLGMVLFFESGMEITSGGWSGAFFNQEMGVSAEKAVLLLSLYWIGMIVARLILNRLFKVYSPGTLFYWSLAQAFIGSLLIVNSASLIVASIGLILLGTGFAAIYPVILGYVGDMYPDISGTAFSIVLVMALIGGMVIPWLTGLLGLHFGLRMSFLLITACLCCSCITFTLFFRAKQ